MESKFKKNSLAIIIPMYNEEIVASQCVDQVMNIVGKLKNSTLIVINDGSVDNTGLILKKKLLRYKKQFIVVTHKINKGYGTATQTGIKKALSLGFEWCLHMDSDLTNDPKQIPLFVKHMSDEIDCVKASRYVKGGRVVNIPLHRIIISVFGNFVASSVFQIGIKDCTNGFRMVRLEKLKGVPFKERNFSIILEELYYLKKRNAKFKEIPYVLTSRVISKSHFSYNIRIFYDYFKYVIKAAF
jgi:dolichol-phosphate mannosyltransferase